MFHIFKTKHQDHDVVVAPVCGKCIPIEEVADQVFSAKLLGDGFAVIPSSDTVVAPVDGEITMLPSSKHAFGMKTQKGIEILVHIGLDTVNLSGQGFKALVSQGKRVKSGQPVIRFDREFMESRGINLTTMVIFTDGYEKEVNLPYYGMQIQAGDILIA